MNLYRQIIPVLFALFIGYLLSIGLFSLYEFIVFSIIIILYIYFNINLYSIQTILIIITLFLIKYNFNIYQNLDLIDLLTVLSPPIIYIFFRNYFFRIIKKLKIRFYDEIYIIIGVFFISLSILSTYLPFNLFSEILSDIGYFSIVYYILSYSFTRRRPFKNY